jgi:uncharacterized membrane protein YbhN (UPF0104 family)
VVAAALVVAGAVAISVPRVRRAIAEQVKPMAEQAAVSLSTVFQSPARIAASMGGQALVNCAYIATLMACVNAVGGHISIPAVAVVYLSGAALGQAVPTPGGVGGVEAIMSADLAAAGVDVGTALSATLLFRLLRILATSNSPAGYRLDC